MFYTKPMCTYTQFKELKEEAKQKSDEKTRGENKYFLASKEQDNEMVHKQQILKRKENEMNGAITKGGDEIKVMYTNIDGIISRKLELVDYLKEKKPQIVCLTETKLCEEFQTNIENDNYNI